MRVEEAAVLLLTLASAGLLLRPPSRQVVWTFRIVVCAALAWQLWLRGLHWQLFPAMAMLAMTAVLLGRRVRRPRVVFALILATTGLSGALCVALPLFRMPPPTGPYAVGTRVEQWRDPATGRELAVSLWYPVSAAGERRAPYARLRELPLRYVYQHWLRTNAWADAPAAPGPLPVLLFGHMWGGRRTQDTFLAEELASHGYLVAAPDHPGNSDLTERVNGSIVTSDRADALDRLWASTPARVIALWQREQALWVADDRFVLATLAAESARPASWLGGRIDSTRVGAFGHSFGGSVSLALLGQPVAPGQPAVRSAIDMDGWCFGALEHRTDQPVLLLYEADEDGRAGAEPTGQSTDDLLERTDHAAVQASLARYGGFVGHIAGAEHADFTDSTLYSPSHRLTYTGPIGGDRMRTLLRATVLAFFDRTLRGTETAWPADLVLRLESTPPAR